MPRAIVGQLFINFVGNDIEIMLTGQLTQCLKTFRRVDGASWVVGSTDDNRLCTGSNGLFNGGDIEGIPLFLIGIDKNRGAAGQLNHIRITHPAWDGQQDFVPLLHQRHNGGKDRLFASDSDGDLVNRIGQIVFFLQLFRNSFAQFGNTAPDRIFGKAVSNRFDARDLDVVKGACIGFSDIQLDNIFTFCL